MKKMWMFVKKNCFALLFLIAIYFMCAIYVGGLGFRLLDKTPEVKKENVEYIDDFINIKSSAEKNLNVSNNVADLSALETIKQKWATLTTTISSFDGPLTIEQALLKSNAFICKSLGMNYIPGTTFVKLEDANISYLIDDSDVLNQKNNCDVRLNYLSSFSDILKEDEIDVIYVNVPHKTYSMLAAMPVGMRPENYFNLNTYVSERLAQKGVPCLDILPNIERADLSDVYYKTDHHWKSKYGIYTAQKIVQYFNKQYGYDIDDSIYDIENYLEVVYKDAHFGSIGTNATEAFTSAEDFSVYYPYVENDYYLSIPTKDIDLQGDFKIFINQQRLDNAAENSDNAYAAYIYANSAYVSIQNKSIVDDHKVLIIKDSFANVVVPYLAQTISHVDVLDIREEQSDYYKESVLELIKKNKYDQVLFIASSPFDMKSLFIK